MRACRLPTEVAQPLTDVVMLALGLLSPGPVFSSRQVRSAGEHARSQRGRPTHIRAETGGHLGPKHPLTNPVGPVEGHASTCGADGRAGALMAAGASEPMRWPAQRI